MELMNSILFTFLIVFGTWAAFSLILFRLINTLDYKKEVINQHSIEVSTSTVNKGNVTKIKREIKVMHFLYSSFNIIVDETNNMLVLSYTLTPFFQMVCFKNKPISEYFSLNSEKTKILKRYLLNCNEK